MDGQQARQLLARLAPAQFIAAAHLLELLGGAPLTGFRLRCGDYRHFFEPKGQNSIEGTGVRSRREAYR